MFGASWMVVCRGSGYMGYEEEEHYRRAVGSRAQILWVLWCWSSSPVFYYRSMQRTSYPNVVHHPTSSIASLLYVSMAPLANYAIFVYFRPLRIALIMTLHPICICYAFPCPIYPTYLTWLSTPKCIGKLWWWYPSVHYLTPRMFPHRNSSSNHFCVTIWHYCLVLLLLAPVWPVLYEAATLACSSHSSHSSAV